MSLFHHKQSRMCWLAVLLFGPFRAYYSHMENARKEEKRRMSDVFIAFLLFGEKRNQKIKRRKRKTNEKRARNERNKKLKVRERVEALSLFSVWYLILFDCLHVYVCLVITFIRSCLDWKSTGKRARRVEIGLSKYSLALSCSFSFFLVMHLHLSNWKIKGWISKTNTLFPLSLKDLVQENVTETLSVSNFLGPDEFLSHFKPLEMEIISATTRKECVPQGVLCLIGTSDFIQARHMSLQYTNMSATVIPSLFIQLEAPNANSGFSNQCSSIPISTSWYKVTWFRFEWYGGLKKSIFAASSLAFGCWFRFINRKNPNFFRIQRIQTQLFRDFLQKLMGLCYFWNTTILHFLKEYFFKTQGDFSEINYTWKFRTTRVKSLIFPVTLSENFCEVFINHILIHR